MLKEEIMDLKESVKVMETKVHEQSLALEMMAEFKKVGRRWFIISIILLVALLVTNGAWLIHEGQYDTIVEGDATTVESNDGITTYLEDCNAGDINYGENNKN